MLDASRETKVKPLLVILPFHSGDFQLALGLLQWMKDLGGNAGNHPILILGSHKCMNVEMLRMKQAAQAVFSKVTTERAPGIPDESWPRGANVMFRHACELVQTRYHLPFLWMEPDCVPLKRGWIDSIAAEYEVCGHAFMGGIRRQTSNPGLPEIYLPGCSVYPADAFTRLRPRWEPISTAWDVSTAPVTVPNAVKSLLFYEWWGMNGKPPVFKLGRRTTDPVEVMVPDQIPKEAVFFHRNKDGSLIRCLREIHSIPAAPKIEDKPRASEPPCLVMLGGVGDVLIAMPVAYHYSKIHGTPTPFVTSAQCVGLFDGASYIKPVSRAGVDWTSYHEAVAWAQKHYKKVFPMHAGEPEVLRNLRTSHFCHEQYRLAEVTGEYGNFPLVFDRRNRAREADLVAKVSNDRPMFLYNFVGKTSPLSCAPHVLASIRDRWGARLNLVNTSDLRLAYYHDMLGLLDKAIGMIAIDTSNLHLMAASPTPYIALLNDTRIPWSATVPRGNCVFRIGYTRVMDNLGRIHNAIEEMLAGSAVQQKLTRPLLVTLACNGMESVWDVAKRTWEPYCERHGYHLDCRTTMPRPDLAPSWNKLEIVLDALEQSNLVWWVDSDMTVARPNEPLPEPKGDLAFASDWNGLCACMFAARATPWTRAFISAALTLGDVGNEDQFGKGLGCKWEQNTIKLLSREFPGVSKHLGSLPAGMVNDHPHENRGEVFCHFGARSNNQRIAAMKARHNL